MRSRRRYRVIAAALAALAGLVVYAMATEVFPYHTSNHDEGVYLQQAAMLLEGQLYLRPPVPEAFRPWFFVAEGGRMYPKYAPVPAAMFAVGGLLGGYRIALALIAAGVVALAYVVASEAVDRRVGLVAAALLFGSPLFLLDASVFLPYVPTTLWNFLFAAAYFRADRTGSRGWAALAGLAVGVAFFARPYTALLFALPFLAHALWRLSDQRTAALVRLAPTAALGLAGVAASLAYNATVTSDPFLFPYEAFAPEDGLGFGHREILGHDREYTPALALRANAEVLWVFATRWTVAGPVGVALAAVGTFRAWREGFDHLRVTLAGLFLSIPLGNVYFWGNLNVLGDLERSGDGLISFLGPYYHVDLLLPVAVFGAIGLLATADRLRSAVASLDVAGPRVATAVLVVAGIALGAAGLGMAAAPVQDNAVVTEQYEDAYQPVEAAEFDRALVFLPTPYGDWLHHPFQALRNDPGYDGDAVYALDESPFAVADAFPDRDYYRYSYRGEWTPTAGQSVDPRLHEVDVVAGERVRQSVELGVPRYAESVSVRLTDGSESRYGTVPLSDPVSLSLDVTAGNATLRGDGLAEPLSVPVAARDEIELIAFVDYGTGGGFSYQVELPVERTDGGVRALSPHLEVCREAAQCGGEAAYVPGEHPTGVSMNTTLSAP